MSTASALVKDDTAWLGAKPTHPGSGNWGFTLPLHGTSLLPTTVNNQLSYRGETALQQSAIQSINQSFICSWHIKQWSSLNVKMRRAGQPGTRWCTYGWPIKNTKF